MGFQHTLENRKLGGGLAISWGCVVLSVRFCGRCGDVGVGSIGVRAAVPAHVPTTVPSTGAVTLPHGSLLQNVVSPVHAPLCEQRRCAEPDMM